MSKRPLIVIFLTVFIDLVGFGIIIPLNPYLARQFGADAFQVGLLMTVYSLMQFLFAPFWGQISDFWGRRPVILVSLAAAALAHLWFAYASSLTELMMSRALAGVAGANISTAMAYIADVTESKDRSKGMGLIGAAFGLGFVLGPFIGGVMSQVGESLGSEPPFGHSFAAIIASVICGANWLLAVFVLKESLKPELRGVKGSFLSSWRQRPARLKQVFAILKRPVVGPLISITFLSTLALAHMEASLFLYVQDRFALGFAQASWGFAYLGCVLVFTQGYLIRKVLPLYGEKKLLLCGILMASVGLLSIAMTPNLMGLAIAVTLLGIGSGFVTPSLNGSVSLLTEAKEQGGTMGVNQSLSALGRIIGPAAGGMAYRDWHSTAPFLIGATIYFIGFLLAWKIRRSIPERALQT